jgi:iron donor protein CyaY
MQDDTNFPQQAGKALRLLFNAVSPAADDYGFEADYDSGVLTITFHKPDGRIIVAPHPATRQLWLSGDKHSFKLGWDIVEGAFTFDPTGQTVKELLEEAISRRVGDDVSL